MAKVFTVLTFVLFVLILFPKEAFAKHGRVLGTATNSKNVDLSINQGPGLLLPSSPFYFLDIWKNNLRLLFSSFDSTQKAKVHLEIAGERIAEVKMLLETKDVHPRFLDAALNSLAENVEGAKAALKSEKNKGANVSALARELDDTIMRQQDSLTALSNVATEQTALRIDAAQVELENEAAEIEDELPEDELQARLQEKLVKKIENEIEDAKDSSENAFELATELDREASEAARKNLKRLEKVVEQEAKEQKKKAQELLRVEQEKQKEQEGARSKILKKTQEAAQKAGEASKAVEDAKERSGKSGEDTSGSSGSRSESSGSSSSGSSTSGSSGSGSSGSGSSGTGSD